MQNRIVLNTCPNCNGSGEVLPVRTGLFVSEIFECPNCHARLIASVPSKGLRRLEFFNLIAGVLATQPGWTAETIITYIVLGSIASLMPASKLRFEVYRRWQFSLGSLLAFSVNMGAVLWGLSVRSAWPIIASSAMLLLLLRRRARQQQIFATQAAS